MTTDGSRTLERNDRDSSLTSSHSTRDLERAARTQRQRRASMVRIDYMPSTAALEAIAVMRAKRQPGTVEATNSAVISAIVMEWAKLTGNLLPVRAHVYEFGSDTGVSAAIAGGRVRAYDSDDQLPSWTAAWMKTTKDRNSRKRVTCGATRHRDGKPCQAKSEPGKRRCRFHGGKSTGPKTPEGKARSLQNLRQNRREE